MITDALNPRYREAFATAIATAEAAKQAGTIPNQVYLAGKDTVNRAFEQAWGTIADQYLNNGKFRDLPPAVYEFSWQLNSPQVHTVAGYLKRAEKFKLNHPMVQAMIALLREMAPVAQLFTDLKAMVTKRQPKPVEERKEGYHPPLVSSEAQAKVVTLLEQVTEASYTALRQRLIENMRATLTGYLTAQEQETKTALSPYDFFVRRASRSPNHAAMHLVDALTDTERHPQFLSGLLHVAKPNAEALIEQAATKQADDIRTAFVHKNYAKIASIIDAKGNYESGQEIGHSVSLGGLTGSFRFTFTDGSRFEVTNQVVYVVNQQGTRFLRFPLTFHAVVMPGGQKMPRPSEERMNLIFAKATA